jgi:hypothetical protein
MNIPPVITKNSGSEGDPSRPTLAKFDIDIAEQKAHRRSWYLVAANVVIRPLTVDDIVFPIPGGGILSQRLGHRVNQSLVGGIPFSKESLPRY